MQGLFKLGMVGSKEQMADFIEKSQKNEMLKNWVITEEIEDRLRSVEGSGLKRFLDKYKLVIENTSSDNIKEIEELADEISKISPELEVILLTQYLDSCALTEWFIYYCPSGKTENIAELAMISKGEEGIDWPTMKEYFNMGMRKLDINMEEVWKFYERKEDDYEEKITKEILEYFIAQIKGTAQEETPEGYDENWESCDYLLEDFYNEKSKNVGYSYNYNDEKLPSLAYVTRLFGEKFVKHFRFIPKTYDKRFEGKVFAIVGEPDDYGRTKTKNLITKFGGSIKNTVSDNTDYLIVGDYAKESKIEKAKALGIPIIDVEEFEKMISEEEISL